MAKFIHRRQSFGGKIRVDGITRHLILSLPSHPRLLNSDYRVVVSVSVRDGSLPKSRVFRRLGLNCKISFIPETAFTDPAFASPFSSLFIERNLDDPAFLLFVCGRESRRGCEPIRWLAKRDRDPAEDPEISLRIFPVINRSWPRYPLLPPRLI